MRYTGFSVSYDARLVHKCQGQITSLDSDLMYSPCGHIPSHMIHTDDHEYYTCVQCGLAHLDENPKASMRIIPPEPGHAEDDSLSE